MTWQQGRGNAWLKWGGASSPTVYSWHYQLLHCAILDGAMAVFNVDEAREFLEALKNEDPCPRDTMKRAVMELWPVISGLVDRGYTRKQVYDLLGARFDIRISYGTFRSYLYQAERERKAGGGKDGDV